MGGPGSGNFGHSGRPGERGGSGGGGGVGSAFSSAPGSSGKEARAWIKANQDRYDNDPEFRRVVDAATVFTQGGYKDLFILTAEENGVAHDENRSGSK